MFRTRNKQDLKGTQHDDHLVHRRRGIAERGLMSWIRNRRARAACRASLAELPHHLRRDIGVNVGLPLARDKDGGRVFIVNGRPDSMDSDWHE